MGVGEEIRPPSFFLIFLLCSGYFVVVSVELCVVKSVVKCRNLHAIF